MSEGSDTSGPRPAQGILFAHGQLASGMVDALRQISGADEDAVVPISNDGKGPEELRRIVEELVGDAPAVVFADLHSGSCAIAARLACRERPQRAVICGVNLAMLLDFVFNRTLPLDQLVPRLVSKAQSAIAGFTPDSGEPSGSAP